MVFSGNSGPDTTVDDAGTMPGIASDATDDSGANAAQTGAQNTPESDAAPNPSSSSNPKMHPVEIICIDYVSSGQMMNGTLTNCHRGWAYERYEILFSEIGFAGAMQTENQHTNYIGDTIYAINLETNTGTQTVNPMYAGLASAMENSTSEEMSAAFVTAMGYTPTGESKTIASNDCNVYSAAQKGTICLTPHGLMLEQDFLGNKQLAVSVSIGDGGEDANYTPYQTVPITDGPDLSNGLEGLMEQFGQQ